MLGNARLMLSELLRASNARRAQTESARAQLLAMLGHDLRDPLHSINMAGTLIERGRAQQTLGRRIQSSSNRMQRLIGQVLDMSRIDGGLGLGLVLDALDLAALAEDVLDEARTSYPNIAYRFTDPQGDVMICDGRYVWVYLPASSPGRVNRTVCGGAGDAAGSLDLIGEFFTNPRDRYTIGDGGAATVGNIELRCRAHNQYEAAVWSGDVH